MGHMRPTGIASPDWLIAVASGLLQRPSRILQNAACLFLLLSSARRVALLPASRMLNQTSVMTLETKHHPQSLLQYRWETFIARC
jgi:hypothetical protein